MPDAPLPDDSNISMTDPVPSLGSADAADFLDNSPVAMSCFSGAGKLLWANRAELTLLGYAPDEYVGHHIFEFHSDNRNADEILHRLAAGETLNGYECRMRRKDGSLLHVAISASGLWREEKLVHARSITHEIGRQRRLEIELRQRAGELEKLLTQNEALLAQLACLLEAAPIGVAFLDTQLRYVRLNSAMAALHGAPLEGHIGRKPSEVMRVGGEEAEQLYRRVLSGGKPEISVQDAELWGRATGQRLACSYYPVNSPDGERLGIGVVAADVTQHVKMLAALRDAQESLRKVISNSPLALLVVDREGRVQMAEGRALQALKLPPHQAVGSSVFELFSQPAELDALHRALKGETVQLQAHLGNLWFDVHISPMRDEGGALASVFIVAIDVSQQKNAEIRRRELEGAFTQVRRLEGLRVLASGLGHDLNNLLTAVAGNAQLALMRLPPAAPARFNVEQIAAAARHANDLTREMLAVTGSTKTELKPLDLNRFVAGLAEVLDLPLGGKIIVRKDFAPLLPAIKGDSTQLSRIVMGLMQNAADAIGGKNGVITLSTGCIKADREYLSKCAGGEQLQPGQYVYLDVTDNGEGMDEATRDRLFLPFFSTKRSGAGLTLAAALGRMRSHGGAILATTAPGKGSTFRLLFPASAAAVEEAPPPPADTGLPWRPDQSVLVVDDDVAVRNVAKMILEEFKLKPVLAEHGLHALEIFRQRSGEFALVILDLTMPGMSGEETLAELRKIRPDIKVVISTGYTEREVAVRLSNQHISGFLPKPYGPAQVKDILSQVLTPPRR